MKVIGDMDMPTFQMSEKTEEIFLQAAKDYKAGNTTAITDIDGFLDTILLTDIVTHDEY